MSLTLESPAFKQQELIPQRYTCDGKDVPPTLIWRNIPSQTQSFVLMIDDLDAPNGTWTHWLLFNIPRTITRLDEKKSLPQQVLVGQNSWGQHQYGGPCPPRGIHRYIFRLYALDTKLSVNANVSNADITNAMQNHILEETSLTGLYGRK